MKKTLSFCFTIFCLQAFAQVVPIQYGHAHNDYMHKKPLTEALESGFTSIEIDVFLYHNQLKVSHTPAGLAKKPDIEELYLKPMKERLERNHGEVYLGYSVPVIFMIDFKTASGETYVKLKEILAKYMSILTLYRKDSIIHVGPVQILISGNNPFSEVMKEDSSFVTIDAGIKALRDTKYDKVITRYSDPWGAYFSWKGTGTMPDSQKTKLDTLIEEAHRKGKHLRFYAIPDNPGLWQLLLDEHVDWVNTDKLKEYRKFYEARFRKKI